MIDNFIQEVNDVQCHSCIFKHVSDGGFDLHPQRFSEIQMYLCSGRQHTCHNTEKVCRGGRDFQLKIMHRMNLIDEPTDAALDKANAEYLKQKQEET